MANEDLLMCNLGLAKLGGGKDTISISSLSDTDPTSVLLNRLFNPTRKRVIKRGNWQETTKYGEAAESSTYTGEYGDWDYVFDLPADYLLLIKQTHEDNLDTEYPCEVVDSQIFSNVYTNSDGDAAYIKYKWNNTTYSEYSDELIEAVATLIAAEAAIQILKGEEAEKKRHYLLREFEELVLPVSDSVNQSQQYKRNVFRQHWPILGGRIRKYI